MKRLKALLWDWDPAPTAWRATARLGLILIAIETFACLALIVIFEAIS